ncbi:MAG: hypothetical protein GY715_20170 [Planctomycetes bacterium]|nr:hypothetical protein [Planctomycetota bacterium]
MAHRTPLALGAVALLALTVVAHGQTAERPRTRPSMPTAPAATQPATTEPAAISDADRKRAIEVVHRAVKAMGGKDALAKIKSSHMQAEVTVPMAQGPMTFDTFWARPNKAIVRQSVDTPMGNVRIEQGTDGTIGWSHNSMEGVYRLLSDAETKQLQRDANRQLTLGEMAEEAKNVASIEAAEFDGMPCQKLRFHDEEKIAAYFNDETGLFAGMSMVEKNPMGGEMEQRMMFRDWRKVGNIKLAHLIVMSMPGMEASMKFTKVDLNKVDPAVFTPPDQVKEMIAQRKPTTRPSMVPGTQPAKPARKLNPAMDQIARRIDQMQNVADLVAMRTQLDGMRGLITEEKDLADLEIVLQKIDARIAELEGGG